MDVKNPKKVIKYQMPKHDNFLYNLIQIPFLYNKKKRSFAYQCLLQLLYFLSQTIRQLRLSLITEVIMSD